MQGTNTITLVTTTCNARTHYLVIKKRGQNLLSRIPLLSHRPIASMDLGTSLRLSSSIQPSIFTSPSLHRSCLSISAANPPPSNASFPIFTTFSQRDFTCCRVSIKDSVTSMYEVKYAFDFIYFFAFSSLQTRIFIEKRGLCTVSVVLPALLMASLPM